MLEPNLGHVTGQWSLSTTWVGVCVCVCVRACVCVCEGGDMGKIAFTKSVKILTVLLDIDHICWNQSKQNESIKMIAIPGHDMHFLLTL